MCVCVCLCVCVVLHVQYVLLTASSYCSFAFFIKGSFHYSLIDGFVNEFAVAILMCLCVCVYTHVCVSRLAEERMSRELAESRLRLQEDQLAELQEELRRVSENSPNSDSLQTVLTHIYSPHTHTHTHTQNNTSQHSFLSVHLTVFVSVSLSAGCDDSAGRPGRGRHATSAPGGDSTPAGAGADGSEGGAKGGG